MSDLQRLVGLLGRGRVMENYIAPGLRSTFLGSAAGGGKLRLFEMAREQEAWIVPHDHRYDFECHVLAGRVENILYDVEACQQHLATHAALPYDLPTRSLRMESPRWCRAAQRPSVYEEGDWYGMRASQFHSIRFEKGTRVLFVEGPETTPDSYCLVPYCGGRICSTFYWNGWMQEEAR